MYEHIEPAELAFDDDGTPRSTRFDDVYHTRTGALGQARHVFLRGNGLPARWQGRRRFTILETGFGLGLNFLATWAAWRDDPARSDCLHFVSVEKHPLTATDLARLLEGFPELGPMSQALVCDWPLPLPGIHRLSLEGGRVVLTLLFGDATSALEKLVCRADALYLDGFSPACNPELWSPRICHLLARLCAPQATLATWSVAGAVREALGHAGFDLQRSAGFAGKREMLTGQLNATLSARAEAAMPAPRERRAIVVGAGLAGTAVAQRLAARGWQIDLIDAADGPGQGASGNLAGVLRPLPSLDDNRLSRLTRAGTLHGLRHLAMLEALGQAPRWSRCGVLHLARDRDHQAKQAQVVEAHAPPAAYLRFVEQAEAARLAGWPVEAGGWWFEQAGWVQPPSLCAANLAACGDRLHSHFGTRFARFERLGEHWLARSDDGAVIAEAPHLILANGVGIGAFAPSRVLPVRPARGQVTHLDAADGTPPDVVVCRLGYVSPAIDGVRCAGATFQVADDEPALRDADQAENLSRLELMLPGFGETLLAPRLAGRVGFRPASPDRLPMVGELPTGERPDGATLAGHLPRHPGLFAISGFGARGLVWSSLIGELVASQLDGDPLPLERDIVEGLDPGRFLLRPSRARIRNDE
ncbi:MAG: bifunctional tRNA (5-methylaminomethyl-2-thiouridine)(34)-methyltransferase MnmD/FAD-dependent 5-carboxymethylaminomethyl-2-thiouridine(34) oxidoreductase MnmC [Rhodocyclaceae bacterium]|nr:bifunctional tRNA (5-methylaminomethyl-2-thiouridine)(34)-methyltransferase MnmD/FAD-dependent 5-carboxymethylaminomethyl-2-thiouridine(34) oxidoreductase MnmC [Rhodocyclaceae bacterium]